MRKPPWPGLVAKRPMRSQLALPMGMALLKAYHAKPGSMAAAEHRKGVKWPNKGGGWLH